MFRYIFIFILLLPFLASAEENLSLPKAGFTPQSPLYFLDVLGEKIQEWSTFNPVAKAKLNVEFAAERVAEVQEMLKTRDVDAKGLDTALARLTETKNQAAVWLNKSKEKNINIDKVSADINSKLDNATSILDAAFIDGIQSFADWRSDLQLLITQSQQKDQTALADDFKKQLLKVESQINLIESKMTLVPVEALTADTKKEETPVIATPPTPVKKLPVINSKPPVTPPLAKPVSKPSAGKIKAEATLQGVHQLKSRIDDLVLEAGLELEESAFENYFLFYPQIEKNIASGNYAQAEETASLLREDLISVEQELKDYIANN